MPEIRPNVGKSSGKPAALHAIRQKLKTVIEEQVTLTVLHIGK